VDAPVGAPGNYGTWGEKFQFRAGAVCATS